MINGSLVDAPTVRKQAQILTDGGFEVLIIWKEMWAVMAEEYYRRCAEFDADDEIVIGHSVSFKNNLWRCYEFEDKELY